MKDIPISIRDRRRVVTVLPESGARTRNDTGDGRGPVAGDRSDDNNDFVVPATLRRREETHPVVGE